MSTITADLPSPPRTSPGASRPETPKHLFNPVADFLLLGGATFLLIPLFLLLPAGLLDRAEVLVWTTALAHAINNPHFAHSYHLFYRGFRQKALAPEYPRDWRLRYLAAGVLAPLALLGFFTYCILAHEPGLLGYAVNLMFFTVGWHYTKQGYGMLMLDAVLKRRFFSEAEKALLLQHAYAVWALSWITANQVFAQNEYWGIAWHTFEIPALVRHAAWAAVILTGARVLWSFELRLRAGGRLPVNGLVGYAVSGYVWLLYTDPILVLLFPALHSLQYMVVVWRYELNLQTERLHLEEGGRPDEPPDAAPFSLGLRMAGFYAIAVGLGYAGFWYFPATLGKWLPETLRGMGSGVFLYCVWVFINVHHYCMDSVVWRKGNPETGRYLFR